MKQPLFRRTRSVRSRLERAKRAFRFFLKTLIVVVIEPAPVVAVVCWIWWRFFFHGSRHFSTGTENTVTTAVISVGILILGMFASHCIEFAWKKLETVRMSVRRNDFYTFALYRDERTSPLWHGFMLVQILLLLVGVMHIHYETAFDGLSCIALFTYPFTLYFVVLIEIDNPCGGIFFLKKVTNEWLNADVDEYLTSVHGEKLTIPKLRIERRRQRERSLGEVA
jgi:hypothetical protein